VQGTMQMPGTDQWGQWKIRPWAATESKNGGRADSHPFSKVGES